MSCKYVCSYCETELDEVDFKPSEAYVVTCGNCKAELAVVAPKKVIPLLPKDLMPKEEK